MKATTSGSRLAVLSCGRTPCGQPVLQGVACQGRVSWQSAHTFMALPRSSSSLAAAASAVALLIRQVKTVTRHHQGARNPPHKRPGCAGTQRPPSCWVVGLLGSIRILGFGGFQDFRVQGDG